MPGFRITFLVLVLSLLSVTVDAKKDLLADFDPGPSAADMISSVLSLHETRKGGPAPDGEPAFPVQQPDAETGLCPPCPSCSGGGAHASAVTYGGGKSNCNADKLLAVLDSSEQKMMMMTGKYNKEKKKERKEAYFHKITREGARYLGIKDSVRAAIPGHRFKPIDVEPTALGRRLLNDHEADLDLGRLLHDWEAELLHELFEESGE